MSPFYIKSTLSVYTIVWIYKYYSQKSYAVYCDYISCFAIFFLPQVNNRLLIFVFLGFLLSYPSFLPKVSSVSLNLFSLATHIRYLIDFISFSEITLLESSVCFSNLYFLCSRPALGILSRDFSSLLCQGPVAWTPEKGKGDFLQSSATGSRIWFLPLCLCYCFDRLHSSAASWEGCLLFLIISWDS